MIFPDTRSKLNDIHAVIFDLDGTMVDSVPDIHLALNLMKADLSLPKIDVELVRRFVGRGSENLVRSTLSTDLDTGDVQQILPKAMTLFYRHYRTTNGYHSTIYPSVKEGLQRMRENGLRLACVTNKPAIFTEPLLAQKGLYDFFHIIYSADSFPRKKPDPFPMQMACLKFGTLPSQTLVIGDSINDAQAARAAGCSLFIVPYGYNHGQSVEEIDSDGIVPDILTAAHLIM
ncbi:MAG: phosphoglycolate phosphatase [Betaproteobacteria bacterium]|nr:phosphoglycolate phosphatase [Betaproteobacteria bacterium]